MKEILGPTGFYERRGAEAVLLVHGLTGTPAEMRHVAKRLAQRGFSVLCPTLAGHCGSLAELKRSRWQDWYASVERAFEALAARHVRVYVSGLSMGALLALRLGAEKGARIAGLGILSATFDYDGWNMPHFKRRWLLPLVLNTPLRHVVSWQETPPYGIKCERTRALVHAALQRREARAAREVGIFRTPAVTIRESVRLIEAARQALPHVQTPALVVHAVEDDMASVQNAHYVVDKIGARQVETYFVDDCYHVLTLDKRRDDVARRVADFFRRCATPA
jgi:carboxylesterase